MDIRIEPLTEKNKYEARDLAVKAEVGRKLQVIRYYNTCLRKHDNNLFVATLNKRVVGIIGWFIDDGHWAGRSLKTLFPYGSDIYWVSFFAVDEEYRGKNIGTLLMKELIHRLKAKHAKELWTYTGRARAFYEKMGFVFVTHAHIEHSDCDFLKYTFV